MTEKKTAAKAARKYPNELGETFWNLRWQTGQTGWDVGYATPPITEYVNQYPDKNAAVLIPGCGNAYEAAYLLSKGFTDITLLDIAPEAVARLQQKFDGSPAIKVLNGDFFEHQGQYDLILEQTFFCSLVLERRQDYVLKMSELLKPEGRLAGVLFDVDFGKTGPPFGGSRDAYAALFQPYFNIKKLAPCYNSIPPRAGSELFFELTPKATATKRHE